MRHIKKKAFDKNVLRNVMKTMYGMNPYDSLICTCKDPVFDPDYDPNVKIKQIHTIMGLRSNSPALKGRTIR